MRCPDPTFSVYRPDTYFGAISERLERLMDSYVMKNQSNKRDFLTTMCIKNITSLASPGEPVGESFFTFYKSFYLNFRPTIKYIDLNINFDWLINGIRGHRVIQ